MATMSAVRFATPPCGYTYRGSHTEPSQPFGRCGFVLVPKISKSSKTERFRSMGQGVQGEMGSKRKEGGRREGQGRTFPGAQTVSRQDCMRVGILDYRLKLPHPMGLLDLRPRAHSIENLSRSLWVPGHSQAVHWVCNIRVSKSCLTKV